MQNFYDLKKQLELCLINLKSLQERKEILNSFLNPRTFKISEVPTHGGAKSDPFVTYTYEMINIDRQIELVKKEINILQKNIKLMEDVLRRIDGQTYKIFVYRYIDGLKVDDIAMKTNYSKRRVYQILNKIEKNIKI